MKWRKITDDISKFFKKNLGGPAQAGSAEDSSDTIEYNVKCKLKKGTVMSSAKIKEIILQNPWSTLNPPAITFHTDENGSTSVSITFWVLSAEKGKFVENELRSALTDMTLEEN